MFEIKCLKCGETVSFKEGVNDESRIEIRGEVEVFFDASVFLYCTCGNEIAIEKP
jgi:hypothetical protein